MAGSRMSRPMWQPSGKVPISKTGWSWTNCHCFSQVWRSQVLELLFLALASVFLSPPKRKAAVPAPHTYSEWGWTCRPVDGLRCWLGGSLATDYSAKLQGVSETLFLFIWRTIKFDLLLGAHTFPLSLLPSHSPFYNPKMSKSLTHGHRTSPFFAFKINFNKEFDCTVFLVSTILLTTGRPTIPKLQQSSKNSDRNVRITI